MCICACTHLGAGPGVAANVLAGICALHIHVRACVSDRKAQWCIRAFLSVSPVRGEIV